jgi:hypothetical protein
MAHVEELVASVQDEIGRDAYVMYPNSHRLIPDAVLWAFASACVLEYTKSFVDLKGLGEKSRALVEELLDRWKGKDEFESFAQREGLADRVADAVVQTLPATIPPQSRASAIADLATALEGLGMRAADARRHAAGIADIVAASLK